MAYIVGEDRNQLRIITTSLDDLIDKDNAVRVIDAYVKSLYLKQLGFLEYSGSNRRFHFCHLVSYVCFSSVVLYPILTPFFNSI